VDAAGAEGAAAADRAEVAMGRHHQFHIDHAGHSITVTVRSGWSHEVGLLVDGKEVDHREPHGAGTTLLRAELPEDPPTPFSVAVHEPRFGSGVPRCSLRMAGAQEPMPERVAA
jgi:hypothetical protein